MSSGTFCAVTDVDAHWQPPFWHALSPQSILQRPQFFWSAERSSSQPFSGFPSQSPQFVAHAKLHFPMKHVGAAFAPAGHTLPHAPQFFMSLSVFVSQPSEGSL